MVINMKIPKDSQVVKTPVQASFHLDRGSSLIMFLDDKGSIMITKDQDKEDHYDLALIPALGRSKLYEGNFQAVTEMLKDYEFYATDKAELVEKKPSFLDKVADWLQRRR